MKMTSRSKRPKREISRSKREIFPRASLLRIFAERLAEAIRSSGVTKEEVHRALGVERQSMVQWLRGENFPRIPTVVAICLLFDVCPNTILGWEQIKHEVSGRMAV